jgi:hypothetical protein
MLSSIDKNKLAGLLKDIPSFKRKNPILIIEEHLHLAKKLYYSVMKI